MPDQPALFDVPQPERQPSVSRSEQGRTGMTYARTVTADIHLRRRESLCTWAVRVFDHAPTIVIGEADDTDDDQRTRRLLRRDWLAALNWLLDPTAGLRPLFEADAVRLPTADISVHPSGPTGCRLQWTVTVKLGDVAALRQIALDVCPPDNAAARAEITTSLAAAWRWAAEPYTPLHHIPGITWTPVDVAVEHRPARSHRGR
ncbi:hypothetical protein [Virgisporangium aurantiacum]|uniref:Uncharacterized protein n=1 Tax=Virgisporangium aurantiacum TaxID=175570 RepID=A0A8J3Z5J0_9ACTN|nr:hypothetical protein [Virgisporangium aurantiacum]GIJ57719.1 hypothetical protein Vau01_052350 [Virgisporangium aurantiacum]